MYLDANNLNRWPMSQKLPVDGFKQVKDLSKINESFIKNYNENNQKAYFLEVDVEFPKYYSVFLEIYNFCLKEVKLKNARSLFVLYKTKRTTSFK